MNSTTGKGNHIDHYEPNHILQGIKETVKRITRKNSSIHNHTVRLYHTILRN